MRKVLRGIINYPIRGIGQTTLDKLTLYSNEKNITLYEAISTLNKNDLNINSGTKTKINNFSTTD